MTNSSAFDHSSVSLERLDGDGESRHLSLCTSILPPSNVERFIAMTRFFHAREIARPEDVRPYLAKPDLHWRKGYSAYELATSWVRANGIPAPVRAVLDTCEDFRGAELVEGLFERDVDLRTPGRPSQTDLLALISMRNEYAVVAVEGKVDEPFGPLVSEWNDASPGKVERLGALCRTLRLPDDVAALRYQLIHRTVSAVYEAERYRCRKAMMLVHSFSPAQTSFADFAAFTQAIGAPVGAPGRVSDPIDCGGVAVRFAWCADAPSQ